MPPRGWRPRTGTNTEDHQPCRRAEMSDLGRQRTFAAEAQEKFSSEACLQRLPRLPRQTGVNLVQGTAVSRNCSGKSEPTAGPLIAKSRGASMKLSDSSHAFCGLAVVFLALPLKTEAVVLAPVAPADTQACYDYTLADAAIKDCITLVRLPDAAETKLYRFRSAEAKFYAYRAELDASQSCADHAISISRRLGKPRSSSPKTLSNSRLLSERHLLEWKSGQFSAELECLPGPGGEMSFLVMNGRTPERIREGLLSHASVNAMDPGEVLRKTGPWLESRIEELKAAGHIDRAAELLHLCGSARNPSCEKAAIELPGDAHVAANDEAKDQESSSATDPVATDWRGTQPSATAITTTDVSFAPSPDARKSPSSWLVCESSIRANRNEKTCLVVPVGPEGISIKGASIGVALAPISPGQPPSIAMLKRGEDACLEIYRRFRSAFGEPRHSSGSPTLVPPTSDSSAAWNIQSYKVHLSCQVDPHMATVTARQGEDMVASVPSHPDSLEEYLGEKLRFAGESVLDSIDDISRSIGPVPARGALEACVDSGNELCAAQKESLLRAWASDPDPRSAEALTSRAESQSPRAPDSAVGKSTPQRDAETLPDTIRDTAIVSAEADEKRPQRELLPAVRPAFKEPETLVSQQTERGSSCPPQVRFSNGIRVVKVGCDLSVVLRRGQVSGRYVDLVIEAWNETGRDETIGPSLVSASSGSVLTYQQAESRIQRGTMGEAFGRFLVGAVEVWGSAGSSTRSVTQGTVSGHVDGSYVSGRYSATTIDFSEGRRRADAAIARADADFDQIEREGEAELAELEGQYLRPHTLAPGERIVRFVTLKLDRRLAANETFLVMIKTRDGSHWVDL